MKKNRVISLALAAVMALSLLSGCSSSTSTTTDTTATTTTTTTATTGSEDLVIAMSEDLETFDPVATSAVATQAVHKAIYVRLYGEDVDSQPVDWLAKEFNVISDTEIQIVIHDDFLFSDGSPVTASDVAYSLNRALASPNFSTLMATVVSYEAIDDTTIKITTTGTSPSIKLALMHPGTSILPQSYIEEAEATGDWTSPVCSGPFMVESRTIGESVVIVKNEYFADEATEAQSSSITFKCVPESSSRTIMVETGEADVNFAFSSADYARATEDESLTVYENVGTVVQYIGFDTTLEPFDDPLVRLAISYAINREDVMTVVAEGLGQVAYCVIPPSTLGYVENPADYTYDPEYAMELLAEAGYPDGFETDLIAFTDLASNICEIVQMFLAEVGIDATIQVYDTSVRMDMIANHLVPMFSGSWGAMSDADLVLPRLFTESAIGAMNFTYYTHPDLDGIFDAARATYDVDERVALYEEAVTIIAEDAAWCPLYISSSFALTSSALQGVEVNGESIINLYKLHY